MPVDLAVLGLGPLGLSAVRNATAAGLRTLGYEPAPGAVEELAAGRAPADGSLSAPELRRMLKSGFTPTADPDVLGRARTALLCAPTPPAADGSLDLTAVLTAAATLARRLRPRTTVVVESTVPPGATESVVRDVLETGSGLRAGRDFQLACAPGRPGDGPRVIAGLTPACTEAAAAAYGRLTDKVVRARGLREAETAKLLENNIAHVNTALVNEMAILCHDLGVDLWDVLRCADTRPSADAYRPGPGVGGHDVPVDPAQLATPRRAFGHPPRLVALARAVNDRMPEYVVHRAAALLNEHGKSARGARLLLLGVTHRPDLADQTGSPAREVAARLTDLGADLSYHDPHVPHWSIAGRPVPRVDSLYDAAAEADLTVLLQNHRVYDLQGLAAKAQLLLDTRGASPAGVAHRL
ncbi:nucleotide sugar dehydrogenase [Streptomyces durbertensis]|uniref:Nucleotide sugar dehydrogenase n=1 Tax=Streptomyces durbertensis TaxID=2448886 RepID=A0ABR6EHW0_9ACTN|nr:nucleotide sugar dehydrogenase [Streptomyces durbertensis]MBB1244667.1 nucleotide sugar dehydrogenase [Streptomyces durbertensis]